MLVALTIIRYSKSTIPMAFLAMAVHRIPLYLNRKCSFWKLMGSGKNGTFDKQADLQQWHFPYSDKSKPFPLGSEMLCVARTFLSPANETAIDWPVINKGN